MKALPLGVDDFSNVQAYYYVDKTLFIKEIIDNYRYKSVLITRPRGFGKSTNLSMLDCFFNLKKQSEPLFLDKAIYEQGKPYLRHMNQYPVVHLNMRSVNGNSEREIIDKATTEISLLYKSHAYLLESSSLFEDDRAYFLSVANRKLEELYQYQSAIRRLTLMLEAHFGKKVVLLIDEYDMPVRSAYENGVYDQCMPFFKELYSNALKDNPSIFLAVSSGVLQVSKESLFSGLNNLQVCNVTSNSLSPYFGFTEGEVQSIIDYYSLPDPLEELRRWYGGYRFGESVLFSPWSILNYAQERQKKNYWIHTGTNILLDKLLEGKESLFELVGSETPVRINTSVSYRELDRDPTSCFSYLVQSGYLVASFFTPPDQYLLSVPNEEISELFQKEVIGKDSSEDALTIASNLKHAFQEADVALISEILEHYILVAFSPFDLRNEKQYQTMIAGILAVLFQTHLVYTEFNVKQGRADIILSPKKPHDLGIAIEIKYASYPLSDSKLREKAKSALNQIKKRKYFIEHIRRDCSSIFLYGMAFDQSAHHNILFERYL